MIYVELRMYKRHDADLIMLKGHGVSISKLLVRALDDYTEGKRVKYRLPPPIEAHVNRASTVRYHVKITNPDAEKLLKSIHRGYRNQFCKMLIRDALDAEPLAIFMADRGVVELERKRLSEDAGAPEMCVTEFRLKKTGQTKLDPERIKGKTDKQPERSRDEEGRKEKPVRRERERKEQEHGRKEEATAAAAGKEERDSKSITESKEYPGNKPSAGRQAETEPSDRRPSAAGQSESRPSEERPPVKGHSESRPSEAQSEPSDIDVIAQAFGLFDTSEEAEDDTEGTNASILDRFEQLMNR